jgi:hypothetical protein
MPSWAEYIAGTSPTNDTECFMVSGADVLSGTNVTAWPTVSNRYYSVFSSTNIQDGWPTEPDYQVGGDGTTKTYTNVHAGGCRFLRVGVDLHE